MEARDAALRVLTKNIAGAFLIVSSLIRRLVGMTYGHWSKRELVGVMRWSTESQVKGG